MRPTAKGDEGDLLAKLGLSPLAMLSNNDAANAQASQGLVWLGQRS